MKYFKMRFCDSALMMMILLLLIATLVTTGLSDEVEEKVNVNVCLFTVNIFKLTSSFSFQQQSLVKELQEGKRVIFAAGSVNSKMTLFISGPGGKSDLSSGCTVEVDENKEGIFKITNPPGKLPSGLSSADVIFVCGDSSGSKLVTMSSSSVGALNLPDGGSVQMKIDPKYYSICFDDGSLHLPSSNSLHYWTVSSGGKVDEFHFDRDSISSAGMCIPKGSPSKLCISDTTIAVKDDCTGSTIPSFSAGYLGSAGFLFSTDNSVYIFDAGIFSGMSSSLKKVSSKNAWMGTTTPYQPDVPDDSKWHEDRVFTLSLFSHSFFLINH